MMRFGWMMIFLGGCALRPPVEIYVPETPRQVVQSWSDAFNNDDYSSLEQLIHPLRKGRFAQDRHMVKDRLKTWLVHSYEMGQPVKINQKLPGMKAQLKYQDGRKNYMRDVLLVEADGRWWIWQF